MHANVHTPLTRRSRLIATAIAATTAMLLAMAAWQPSTASASAYGCTGAGPAIEHDLVCLGIYGSGADVDSFRVVYNNNTAAQYPQEACNYEASITVDPPGDFNAYKFWSGRHEGCSYTGTYYFDFPGQNDLPDGTNICGRFYVNNGSQVGGAPCNEIEA